jgi:superfamily II DNA/RNA helicase
MFDMGFLPDIRRVLKYVPAKRQTLLFSATMPDDIRHLAHEILHKPVTVQVGHSAPVNTVSHALYPVEQHLKTALLMEVLRHTNTESVLIFTRTKHRAKRIGQQLEKAGYKAASLQGNLSQNRRQEALDGFRDGSYQILVATDIAARGIDVSSISHVINYDIPDTVDAYTHRIGRTGRAAKTGDAFTFVTREDEPLVRSIERVLGEKIERRTLKDFDYKKAAPSRDAEFARPPREPQRRRVPARPEQGRGHAAAPARPKSHHAGPAKSGERSVAASSHRGQPSSPAKTGASRGPSTHQTYGSRAHKDSASRPGSGGRRP